MSARVIAITGGKGGVGKSTTTVNLAVSLRLDGYDVAVVDTDIEMPNLVEMLGLDPTTTIHDVLSGRAETSEAIIDLGNGFSIVPGDPALSGFATVEPSKLQEVVSDLRAAKEIVILDTGAGLSYDDVLPLSLADEVIVVTSPDPPAVQNAARTEAFVHRLNQTVSGVVVTRATDPIDEAVKDAFEAQIVGVIPEDAAVRESTAAGQPLEVYDASSPAAKAYRQLEAALTDGSLPPSSGRGSAEAAEGEEAPTESVNEDETVEAGNSGDGTEADPAPADEQDGDVPAEATPNGGPDGDASTASEPEPAGDEPPEPASEAPGPQPASAGAEADADEASATEADETAVPPKGEGTGDDGADMADETGDDGADMADETGSDGLFARLVKRLGA